MTDVIREFIDLNNSLERDEANGCPYKWRCPEFDKSFREEMDCCDELFHVCSFFQKYLKEDLESSGEIGYRAD